MHTSIHVAQVTQSCSNQACPACESFQLILAGSTPANFPVNVLGTYQLDSAAKNNTNQLLMTYTNVAQSTHLYYISNFWVIGSSVNSSSYLIRMSTSTSILASRSSIWEYLADTAWLSWPQLASSCSQCTAGYYMDSSLAICMPLTECAASEMVSVAATFTSDQQCESCFSVACLSTQYQSATCGSNSSACMSCAPGCSQCTGPQITDCTSCASGRKRFSCILSQTFVHSMLSFC
jgi:hypothetical protein